MRRSASSTSIPHHPSSNSTNVLQIFFYEPPDQLEDRLNLVAGVPSSWKKWVYHKQCYDKYFMTLCEADDCALAFGSISQVRTNEELEEACEYSYYDVFCRYINSALVWGNPNNLVQSHVNTMANHVIHCNNATIADKGCCTMYKQGMSPMHPQDPLNTNIAN